MIKGAIVNYLFGMGWVKKALSASYLCFKNSLILFVQHWDLPLLSQGVSSEGKKMEQENYLTIHSDPGCSGPVSI